MRKLFLTGLAILVFGSAAIFVVSGTLAYAEAFREPMLDGVTNSDFAQWSYTYGHGGMYGEACPPMPQAGMWYEGPPTYVGPPPFAKKKVRNRKK